MTYLARLFAFSFVLALTPVVLRAQQSSSAHGPAATKRSSVPARVPMRELDWDTYVDKVEGAWMGKMIGVTFGQPWEFNYLGAPIGFDIIDWTLSPTAMKDYIAHMDNKEDYDDPVTNEANSKQAISTNSSS